MEGSHTLEKFINGVAKDIEDPETKVSTWKRAQAYLITNGTPEQRADARNRADLRIDALGSGSDYTPFLQHNGVPTLQVGFSGEDDAGIYHSIYDDFYHYTKFLDSDFIYGRALAQTAGTTVMRLADADLLPFEFTNVADTVQMYLKEVQQLLKQKQDEIKERNQQVEDGVFTAMRDPRRPLVAPKQEEVPPALNFAPLENASDALAKAAQRYKKAVESAKPKFAGNSELLQRVNGRLIQSERQFLDPQGLPKRTWFRHLLYAPGYYTGYAVKTMPGVREGIEQKEYKNVEAEAVKIAAALQRETDLINAAAAELEKVE
jgi:N-acetylated-alpha-linked acidic dipeptidase